MAFHNTTVTLFNGLALNITGELALTHPGVHFIVGRNGCGKTILLAVLAKLLGQDEAGPIDTIAVSTYSLSAEFPVPTSIGRVRQDPRENYISRCSSDEIILPMLHPRYSQEEIAKRIDHVLDTCDITEETILRRSIDALSSGQQQLLACCVAFAPRPQVVLLDEPFARLDENASKCVSQLILSGADDAIVIVATHNTANCSDALKQRVKSVITVSRTGANVTLAQGTYAPETAREQFSAEVLTPLKHSITGGSHEATPARSRYRRRIHVVSGTAADIVLSSERLDLMIEDRLAACLLDVKITRGINVVEGANGSGKTLFGQLIGGFVPLNPLVKWSKRYAKGTVALPSHPDGTLAGIRRKGMSVFLPASPDLWLPDRVVEEELQEYHRDGLDSLEAEMVAHADIPMSVRTSHLSYGQKRLLALLALPRALEFVFIDEPFADLSVESARLALRFITKRTTEGTWESAMLSLAHAHDQIGAEP